WPWGYGTWNVYTMNSADGSGVSQLTNCKYTDPSELQSACVNPNWSPDGKRIALNDWDFQGRQHWRRWDLRDEHRRFAIGTTVSQQSLHPRTTLLVDGRPTTHIPFEPTRRLGTLVNDGRRHKSEVE